MSFDAFQNRPSLTPDSSLAQALLTGNWRVVITGASGWLGQATISYLGSVFGKTLSKRVYCFGSSAKVLTVDGYELEQKPIRDLLDFSLDANTLLCHFAFLTKDLACGMSAQEYINQNHEIRETVLSAIKQGDLSGVCVPSSGAVYDALMKKNRDLDANLYGQIKLDDEKIFSEAAVSGGWTFVCPRIFNLSGPFINKLSTYALSSFINDCLLGRPLEIKSTIPVLRSYLFIGDLLNIIFGVLLKAPSELHVGFDTAGDRTVELSDLAELVINRCESNVRILRPIIDRTRENRYVGSPELQTVLQRRFGLSSITLPLQVDMTAAYMRIKLFGINL